MIALYEADWARCPQCGSGIAHLSGVVVERDEKHETYTFEVWGEACGHGWDVIISFGKARICSGTSEPGDMERAILSKSGQCFPEGWLEDEEKPGGKVRC